jgi:flagellar basal-body rod protein FlgG
VFEDNKQVAQVSLAYFPGGTGLQGLGNGQYTAVAAPAAPPGESRIRQGYLEGANAQPMADMVALIDTMRHFEMNQKVIQTIDELQDRSIRGLGEF